MIRECTTGAMQTAGLVFSDCVSAQPDAPLILGKFGECLTALCGIKHTSSSSLQLRNVGIRLCRTHVLVPRIHWPGNRRAIFRKRFGRWI